jgi:hypothetical protein
MATLTLTKVWINRLDSGAAVSAQSLPERARSRSMAGEVRGYAGGRQRSFTQLGLRGVFEFGLVLVSLATVELLESWIGVPVLVRDHRGQAFTGVFYDVPATGHRDDVNAYDVTLSLRLVTAPDGV